MRADAFVTTSTVGAPRAGGVVGRNALRSCDGSGGVGVRKATPGEADEIADHWPRVRAASAPSVPAPIHDDEEARTRFRTVVVPEQEVLVAVSLQRRSDHREEGPPDIHYRWP